jgi:hypothetical protein
MAQSDHSIAYDLLELAKRWTPGPGTVEQAISHAVADFDIRFSVTSLAKQMALSWVKIAIADNHLAFEGTYTPLECRLILSLAQYVGEELNRG